MKKEKRRGADCAGSLIPGDTGRAAALFCCAAVNGCGGWGKWEPGMDWMDQTDQMRWTATKI